MNGLITSFGSDPEPSTITPIPDKIIAMIKDPPHPGTRLREDVLTPLGLSVTEAADRPAMARVALSRVLNGHAGISPALAIRLELAGVSTTRF